MKACGSLLVNVTVPLYNEEVRLALGLPRLHHFLSERCRFGFEIVLANNGSTDRTAELARRFATEMGSVRVLEILERGRGGAIKRAWLTSQAQVLSYMDVDLSTDLEAFPELIYAVACGRADIAVGSRLVAGATTRRGWRREVMSRVYLRLAKMVCGLRCSDAQCGFKALARGAALALLPGVKDSGWFFDTELLVRAQHGGYQIAELPVRWTEDRDSRVKLLRTAWGDLRGLVRLRRELGRTGLAGKRIGVAPKYSRMKIGGMTPNA